MNKFWLYLKKSFVTFVLILSMVSLATLPGCFYDDGEESEEGEINLRDVLYGIRLTYQRQSIDKDKNYISVADEQFIKDLITQYLNISVEVLVSLSSRYGKGVTDFDAVKNNLPTDFGEVTIDNIRYCDSMSSSDENYGKLSNSATFWAWSRHMIDSSASDNLYASYFCSKENLYKMMVALYLINMGKDCSPNGYGAYAESFSASPSKDKIEELAKNYKVTHSGLTVEPEQRLFIEFVLNNVIGASMADEYRDEVTEMITEIFAQTDGTGLNGEIALKYPVVASVTVKDLTIKDISVESDEDEENNGEDDDPEEINANEFFTLKLGQQYYKSLLFMPKSTFNFNGMTLIFESTEDVTLIITVRLHEADTEEGETIEVTLPEFHIMPGAYDDYEGTDDEAELDITISEIISMYTGESGNTNDAGEVSESYEIGEYNQDTDVQCYDGGKYGRALAISNEGEDVTLASLYKISKEDEQSVGRINFFKEDSWYLELVFESVGNKPFNIGFEDFDFED